MKSGEEADTLTSKKNLMNLHLLMVHFFKPLRNEKADTLTSKKNLMKLHLLIVHFLNH
jgi:hypothetical protein